MSDCKHCERLIYNQDTCQPHFNTDQQISNIQVRACLYDPGVLGRPGVPGSRLVDNLLLFSLLRLYGDRDVPVYRDLGL